MSVQIKRYGLILLLLAPIGCNPVPDPVSNPTNTWLSASPLSFRRQNLPGVVLGGRILLIGGLGKPFSDRTVLRDVSAYDPKTDVWVPGTPMPIARTRVGGAVVGDRLYVTGGFTGSSFASSRVYIYDGSEDAWERGPMPTRRAGHAVVAVGGLVYAIGGGNNQVGQLNTSEVYDPVTEEWASLPPMPTARDRIAATAHSDEIYVFGGRRDGVALDAVEAYDPAANRWRVANPMPVPLSGASAVTLGQHIFLFGGAPIGFDSDVEVRPEVWRYNPGADEWDVLPVGMPTPRQSMAAIVYEDRVYLIGGGIGQGFQPSNANEIFIP